MAPSSLFLKAGAAVLVAASLVPTASATYFLNDEYKGDGFFDMFDFLNTKQNVGLHLGFLSRSIYAD
jgi:hypothetical protein